MVNKEGAAHEAGFTYIGLLVAITIIGISTAVVGQTWKTMAKADKERQLLWVGHQYRLAIQRYYEAKELDPAHQGLKMYPAELKDLLKDPRSPGIHRYLRKIYKDPMTGKDDWAFAHPGQLGASLDRISGVHSSSEAVPLKADNFDLDDSNFAGKTKYSEWVFEYPPQVTLLPKAPAPTPPTSP